MDSNLQRREIIGMYGDIDALDPETRASLLKACAHVCAASFPRDHYIAAAAESRDEAAFLRNLTERMPADVYIALPEDHTYEVRYARCLCDLTGEGGVNTPTLCECSRQSLLYCWETLAGAGRADVTLNESVLAGDPICRFTVRLRPGADTVACLR